MSRRLIFTIVCARDAVRPKNTMSRRESNRNLISPSSLIVGIICKIFDWTGQQMWALQENRLDKICFLPSPAGCKWQDMWGATGHEIMRVSGSQRAPCTGLGQAWSLSSKNSQNIFSHSKDHEKHQISHSMLCLTLIFFLPNMFFREVVMNISCVFSWDLTFPSERSRALPIFCGNLTHLTPSEQPSKKQVVQNLIQLGGKLSLSSEQVFFAKISFVVVSFLYQNSLHQA